MIKFIHLILQLKRIVKSFFSEFKNHDWISKKDLLIKENFRTLNSHKHMLWCFSYFHLVFSLSMYFDNCCLLATLTNQIFQDSFLYFHNDTVPFVTGHDRFSDNNYLYLLHLLIQLSITILICFFWFYFLE